MKNKQLNKRLEIDGITSEQFFKEIAEIKNGLAELRVNQPSQFEKLLTVKEVCEMLHISKSTAYNWQKQGILKPYKKGNRTYYKQSEVFQMFADELTKNK